MRKEVIIKNSSGGMANDLFVRDATKAYILEHYDVFTDPNKLKPHLAAESGDGDYTTNGIRAYDFDGTTVYGLGIVNNSGVEELCLFTRTDFTGSTWTADSHFSSPTGSIPSDNTATDTEFIAFKYYRTTGKLYGVHDGRYIWSVTPGTSVSTTEADLTAYTTVSNMLNHSKDDVLYLAYDNKIASKNGSASWNVTALTLPDNFIITRLTEFGNYLAIGCMPKGGGNSRVFLWNRDSSVATLDESIDWGNGNLRVLDELEGYLIGVSFSDTVSSGTIAETRVTCRYYSGAAGAIEFDTFTGYSLSPSISSSPFQFKQRNRILFPAIIPIGTTAYAGVWSVSRPTPSGQFAVTLEHSRRINASPSSGYGLLAIGDILFHSYADNSSVYMDKTDDAKLYTTASIRESLINPGAPDADMALRKQLVAASLSYEPIPSGGQAVLKYRVDGGSWQTLFTETTAAKVVTEKIVSGLIGRNIEFRDESTGGVVITGMRWVYDTLQSII